VSIARVINDLQVYVILLPTKFTCFTSTKVQILTSDVSIARVIQVYVILLRTQFTCFTSTKVQILTLEELQPHLLVELVGWYPEHRRLLLYACTIYMFSSYICVLLLLHVSSYSSTPTLRLHYIYVLFLYMCPPPTICVFILIYAYSTPALYICSLLVYVSSSYYMCLHTHLRRYLEHRRPYYYMSVLLLLCICLATTIHVSSSYYYICVLLLLLLLYMCPPPTPQHRRPYY
jgi:hypothetical protein